MFTDETEKDFALGNHFLTRYDGDGVIPEQSGGTFTSQVFDGGADDTSWLSIEWLPSDAYGLPLPDGGAVDAGYPRGNVDMRDSVLLIHCAGSVDDTSPSALPVAALGGNSVNIEEGVLAEGCSVVPGDHFGVTVDDGSPLDSGTGDYTWALWVRTSTSCDGNDVFMGIDQDVGATTGAHQWLGCAVGSDNIDPACGATVTGAIAGAQLSDQGEGGGELCGNTAINDNSWHHLAITKSGHPDYTLRAYVDGVEEAMTAGSYTAAMDYDGAQLMFGRFPEAGLEVDGPTRVDEIAVWRRALTELEVMSLVLRGGAHIRVSARSCDDERCDGEAFSEPLVDPGAGGPPGEVAITVPPNRYFQYRLEYEIEMPGLAPRVESVTVRAR